MHPRIRTTSFENATDLEAGSILVFTHFPFRYRHIGINDILSSATKPNKALLTIHCLCTVTNKAVVPNTALSMSVSIHIILVLLFFLTSIESLHNHTILKMNAVYNNFKQYLCPNASPPRPLFHVWDLRATNYFTPALSGTGMTPLTVSQLSTKSSAVEAQVLRAQGAAAEAQNQTLKHDKKVWRQDYLRSKKGNVHRKPRNDSREQMLEIRRARTSSASLGVLGKGIALTF